MSRYIHFGDKECEYNKNFRLILHTKLANPHFPPELQAETTLINFTVTPEGLGDQLLGQVVSSERPDLESLKVNVRNLTAFCYLHESFYLIKNNFEMYILSTKMQLTLQQNHFKIELKKFEDDLLSHLSTANSSFLSDNSLVEQLENTKRMATHIQCKVKFLHKNGLWRGVFCVFFFFLWLLSCY